MILLFILKASEQGKIESQETNGKEASARVKKSSSRSSIKSRSSKTSLKSLPAANVSEISPEVHILYFTILLLMIQINYWLLEFIL